MDVWYVWVYGINFVMEGLRYLLVLVLCRVEIKIGERLRFEIVKLKDKVCKKKE